MGFEPMLDGTIQFEKRGGGKQPPLLFINRVSLQTLFLPPLLFSILQSSFYGYIGFSKVKSQL